MGVSCLLVSPGMQEESGVSCSVDSGFVYRREDCERFSKVVTSRLIGAARAYSMNLESMCFFLILRWIG